MLRFLDCTTCSLQQSLLTVLKESFKVYKAISEGLINLADRYFEMEYHDAHKGLEVYKESIVANDRLQQFYQQIEQIEELRRAIQFPKLESPPADFLTQMEAYAKEAPRPYDESSGPAGGSKKVSAACCAVLCCAVLCCGFSMVFVLSAKSCPAKLRKAPIHWIRFCIACLDAMTFSKPGLLFFAEEPSIQEGHQVKSGRPGLCRRTHRHEG